MKRFVAIIFVGFIFILAGCDEDNYCIVNDNWIGFGICHGDENSNKIIMDNGDILIPVSAQWAKSLDDGARVLVNYTILGDKKDVNGNIENYYVRVNAYNDILMKGIMTITPENKDSIGNDAIAISRYWLTDSLLSFKLKYWGYNSIHFLNLVKDTSQITVNSQPIRLELRHNANDDEKAMLYTAYVSFSLNSLRIEGQDSVSFVFTSTDYNGDEYEKECIFNYANLPR